MALGYLQPRVNTLLVEVVEAGQTSQLVFVLEFTHAYDTTGWTGKNVQLPPHSHIECATNGNLYVSQHHIPS